MMKKGKEFWLERGQQIIIGCAQAETTAVHIAAENLGKALKRVLDAEVSFLEDWEKADILIGTLGVSREAESVLDAVHVHKEAYIQAVSSGKLVIAGTDRRGTIYGSYEF